jgi:hypothetical protein
MKQRLLTTPHIIIFEALKLRGMSALSDEEEEFRSTGLSVLTGGAISETPFYLREPA